MPEPRDLGKAASYRQQGQFGVNLRRPHIHTDDTNLSLSYATEQLVFNWEVDRGDLNGGPAKKCSR